ncbi:HYR domain-containing protein, partial [bacterium]|nr:HYR domain-containing protein [bacterium]
VNVDAGVCTTALANVTLGTPTTGDNCSVASTTNDAPASFPLGATTVTYTVTDGSGNTATATQVVTVVDNIDPTIVCPASFTAYGAADSTLTSVSWTAATGTDNCSIDTVYSDVQIGTYFPLGATIVTYVAIDGSGNTDTCSFTITVVDTVSPVITNCPGDITQNNDLDSCGAVVNWTAPTYYDNSGHYTVSASHASGDYFPVGTTAVTITVADSSGNTLVCTFDVTVVDNQAPYVLPFNSVAVTLGTDGMYTLAVNDVDSASYDNCGITAKYLSKSFFNCNDVPSVTTWLVIEDIHGNKDSSLVTVQVALNTTSVLSVVETLGDVLCYGDSTGNASIAVSGGVSPYVYNWSNGSITSQAQNLSLGSYWYEVTDTNGCYKTDTVFIDEPNQLIGIDSVVACDSYTWIDGITYFTSNDTVITTISGQNGCDSLVTLNLTINKIDSTIVRLGSTIYAQTGYDSYQWHECTSSGFVPLNNQTNDSIIITANGDYAAVITNEGCTDTSICMSINDIGYFEYTDITFSLFPNPTTGQIKIVQQGSSLSNNTYQLQLIDSRGRIMEGEKVNFRDNYILMDFQNYPSGVYHLILMNENGIFREQVSIVH